MFQVEGVAFIPNDWPDLPHLGGEHYPHPGDLSRFASFVYRYLGADSHNRYTNPMLNAPQDSGTGGVIYFENSLTRADLEGAMNTMGMVAFPGTPYNYVVYAREAEKPGEEKYLRQLRFISTLAMTHDFHALTDKEEREIHLKTLRVPLVDVVWNFIQGERAEWGTGFGAPKLDRLFGGDSHYAQEELSFGLMVENSHTGIFRLWSRAWLVHK